MMRFSHFDEKGNLRMVDITDKKLTTRSATASGFIKISPATIKQIKKNQIAKGDVLSCAKIAGILASKKVSELIPLTHPINITHTEINFRFLKQPSGIEIKATSKTNYATGVEMEALTAVAISALTIYDMIKSQENKAVITNIKLIKKTGGKRNL